MAKAKKMMTQLRDFVRYHFFTTSVYADKTIEGGRYQSLSSDATGIAKEATISGGSDRLTVTDLSNHSVTIDATNSSKMVNKMARDYWLGKRNANGNIIPADAKNATAPSIRFRSLSTIPSQDALTNNNILRTLKIKIQ